MGMMTCVCILGLHFLYGFIGSTVPENFLGNEWMEGRKEGRKDGREKNLVREWNGNGMNEW